MRIIHTLGLQEDTLLNTTLEGAVEEGVEHGVGGVDVVVGLDVLLQALAAVEGTMLAERSCCAVICLTPSPGHDGFMHPVRGHETHGAGIGEGSCLPRSVTVLELKGGMTRQYEWKTGCKGLACGVLGRGGVAVWSAPWCGQTRHGFTRPLHTRDTRCAGRMGRAIHTCMMASLIISCRLLAPGTIA